MTIEENKLAVKRYLEQAWGEQDWAVAEEVVAEDAIFHDQVRTGDLPPRREGLRVAMERLFTAMPDLTMTIHQMIAEDDLVAVRYRAGGTHVGVFNGLPGTGRLVHVDVIAMLRLQGGRIVEAWQETDGMGLARRLGTMPEGQMPGPVAAGWVAAIRLKDRLAPRADGAARTHHETSGVSGGRGPDTGEAPTSPPAGGRGPQEENKRIVLRYLEEAWGKRDRQVAAEAVAEDAVFHDQVRAGDVPPGRAGVFALMDRMFSASPDLVMDVHQLVAEGDSVAIRYSSTGTHTGELGGIPATGRVTTYEAIAIVRMVDGMIVEGWQEADELWMARQMGVLPPPLPRPLAAVLSAGLRLKDRLSARSAR